MNLTKSTARVPSDRQIVEALGWSAAEDLVKHIEETLQNTVTRAELTEGECLYSNAWDELCAKTQLSLSYYWERLKPFKIGEVEFSKLKAHEREAIWLQTESGEKWRKASDADESYPVDVHEVLDYIFEEYLLWSALVYQNSAILHYVNEERQKVRNSNENALSWLRGDFILYAAEAIREFEPQQISELHGDLIKRFGYWVPFFNLNSRDELRAQIKELFEYDEAGELFDDDVAIDFLKMEPREKAEWAADRITSFAAG
tara:strand:- start:114 stop:890 length:777 start_codon:yes stop_codon:yes gene_type:complete